MINVGVSVKMTRVLVKKVICGILVQVVASVIMHVKHLDIKNCSCKKRLIGKLVLQCKDKILNATENSLDDMRSNMQKT